MTPTAQSKPAAKRAAAKKTTKPAKKTADKPGTTPTAQSKPAAKAGQAPGKTDPPAPDAGGAAGLNAEDASAKLAAEVGAGSATMSDLADALRQETIDREPQLQVGGAELAGAQLASDEHDSMVAAGPR